MPDDLQQTRALATVTAFARALDGDDFSAAGDFLCPNCVYDAPSNRLTGPTAILSAYRTNSEWAARTFDEIAYASEVELVGSDSARITYIDRTNHRGISHEYRCQQFADVGGEGLIVRIRHEEIPGQREALQDYFDRVGVTRD